MARTISRRSAGAAMIACFLSVTTLGGTSAIASDTTRTPEVMDAAEAHRKARDGDLLLIDIRRPEEWAATGSAEGAIRLDMRRPDFGQEVIRLIEGDPTRPVALICARGNRSAWLSDRMLEAGFQSVINVSEGMFGSDAGPGWLARALPVSK